MKTCDHCKETKPGVLTFRSGENSCGQCSRNGKKLSRARVDAYLEENGLVAVKLKDLKAVVKEYREPEIFKHSSAILSGLIAEIERWIKAAKGES